MVAIIPGRGKMAAFVCRHFRFGLGRCAWRELARNEGGLGFPGSGFGSGLDGDGGPVGTVPVQVNGVSHTDVGQYGEYQNSTHWWPRPETRAAYINTGI